MKFRWKSIYIFVSLIIIIIITCAILELSGFYDRNKKHISVEKIEWCIWKDYAVISEDDKNYSIEVPYDILLKLPKNGDWVLHPYYKRNFRDDVGVWYRFRKEAK